MGKHLNELMKWTMVLSLPISKLVSLSIRSSEISKVTNPDPFGLAIFIPSETWKLLQLKQVKKNAYIFYDFII